MENAQIALRMDVGSSGQNTSAKVQGADGKGVPNQFEMCRKIKNSKI